MKSNQKCRVCDAKLNEANWHPSQRKRNERICKECTIKKGRQWRKINPEKAKAIATRQRRKRGVRPFDKNRKCPVFLGVHVAERVLSHVFIDVERMPILNPGYDFVCNKGKRIDVKSSCICKDGRWHFNIYHNPIADYFLCLAFDNREHLTPLHAWLLPGIKFNHLIGTSIRPSTVGKWDAYRLDLTKINTCCDAIRG